MDELRHQAIGLMEEINMDELRHQAIGLMEEIKRHFSATIGSVAGQLAGLEEHATESMRALVSGRQLQETLRGVTFEEAKKMHDAGMSKEACWSFSAASKAGAITRKQPLFQGEAAK